MTTRNEIWAVCSVKTCKHVWIVAYLPMPISKVSKLLRGVRCPKCGDGKVLLASDEDIRRVTEPDKCPKCGGELKLGVALENTVVAGAPDFLGDSKGQTLSQTGQPEAVPVDKCKACGYSRKITLP